MDDLIKHLMELEEKVLTGMGPVRVLEKIRDEIGGRYGDRSSALGTVIEGVATPVKVFASLNESEAKEWIEVYYYPKRGGSFDQKRIAVWESPRGKLHNNMPKRVFELHELEQVVKYVGSLVEENGWGADCKD